MKRKLLFTLLAFLVGIFVVKAQIGGYYTFSESSGTYTELTSPTVSTASGDDGEELAVPIGFSFDYVGTPYTTLTIGVNGAISFTSTNIDYVNNLASTDADNLDYITPLWDDHYLRTEDVGEISYKTEGTTPNQTFTVQWKNLSWRLAGSTVNFQIVLFEGSNNIEFRYGVNNSTETRTASIGLNVTPGNTGNFISVTPGTPATTSTSTANNAIDVADYPGDGHIYTFVYAPPSCMAPTSLVHSNITTTGADLAWTSAESFFDIYIVPAGDPAPTGSTTPTVDDNIGTAYTWTGGNASTAYEWYVRTDCGQDNSNVSIWSGPDGFTTSCATFSLPFSEPFTSSSTPICWSNGGAESWLFSTSAGYGAAAAGDHTSGGGTNYAWIDGSSGISANELLTPYIDASSLTTPAVEFYYFSNNTNTPGDNNTLIVDFWDGAAWNNLLTYAGDNADWQLGLFDLSGYTITGDVQFRFVVTETAATAYYNDILIDDVSVIEMPSCIAPTALVHSNETAYGADLGWTSIDSFFDIYIVGSGAPAPDAGTTPTVNDWNGTAYTWTGGIPSRTYDWYVRTDCGQDNSNVSVWSGPDTFTTLATCPAPTAQTLISVTPTSAEVEWTENGGASTWNIEYGPAGFTQGSGTTIIATANPWTITGLSDATDYDWYVQADCGGGDESTWVGPSGFTTACLATAVPWNEGFEGMATVGAGIVPICMVEDGDFTTSDTPDTYNRMPRNGTNFIYTNWSADDWLYTPPIDLVAGTSYDFSFWYITDGNSGWTTLEAFYGTGQTSGDMTMAVGTAVSGPTNQTYVEYRGSVIPTTSGAYYFGIHVVANYSPWYMSFDDLAVELSPDCPAPSAQEATMVSGYQADLGWTENGGSTAWDIEWGLTGFTQGSGTLVGTTTNPHTLANLSPTTTYDWYVRAVCGPGDESAWTGPHTFTTTVSCPPPTNLSATVTTTTADLAWTAVGTEPSWNIEWGPTGFTQGSGTMILNTTTNPHQLTGLVENTAYDWYIQADCNPLVPSREQSTWAGPHTFNTACPAGTVPYYESFDGVTAPAFPSCLMVEDVNGDGIEWVTYSSAYVSPPNSAKIGYNSGLAMDDWFFTQGLFLTGGVTYSVAFAYGAASAAYPEKLAVDWGTSPTAAAMSGTPIFDNNYIDAWYGGSGTFTPSSDGIYYVGFHGYSDADMWNLYVDDISILEVFPAATWTGTVDNDWDTPGNWNPGLPSSGTDVTIPVLSGPTPNYPTVGSVTTINNLVVESGPGGDASLVNDGLLIIGGTATVQRYLTGGMWHDVAASGQGQTVNSIYFNGSPDVWLKEYLEPTNTRRNITDVNEPMDPGKGFEIWVAGGNNVTADFTGFLQRTDVALTTASTPVAISYSGAEPLGYNLVGNPFASPISLDQGTWAPTDVSTSFWVWDPAAGTYKDWNTATNPGSGSLTNGIIPMGQGFFFQATGPAAAITIPTDARLHSAQPFYKSVNDVDNSKMILKAKLEVGYDEVNIIFHEKATDEFDVFDTRKMFAFNGSASQVYAIQTDEDLSINSLPPLNGEGRIVSIGYIPGVDGMHAFEANLDDLPDTEVFLEDLFTGNLISLVEKAEYEFEANVGDEPERFILHFNPMTTGIGDSENESLISIYAFNDKLYIKSTGAAAKEHKQIVVYDLMGRAAIRTTAEASTLTSIPTQYLNGYVIVKVMSESEVKTTKVYIK